MPNRRKKSRRRRRGGLGRLLRPLSVLLAAAAVVAALTLFFKVDKILVTGGVRYQADQIVTATGIMQGDNLILLDKRAIAQRIRAELPYITDVRINQQFPDTLLIEVLETRATASIQGAGGNWLLSIDESLNRLKLVEFTTQTAAQNYLPIVGIEAEAPEVGSPLTLPEESPIAVGQLAGLLSSLSDLGILSRTDSIDLSDPEILVLHYDGRFRAEMYYDADFDFKLHCLSEAVARLEPNEQGTIRMTMDNDSEVRFIPSGG